MAGRGVALDGRRRGMTDEKSDPPNTAQDLAAAAKRRRPAPTIDLKATEIASEPAAQPQPSDSSQETPENAAPVGADAPSAAKTAKAESSSSSSGDSTASASKEAPRWGRPAWRLSAANESVSGLHAR